ncbi:MAG: flavodoxin domain-containing protein [Methanomassiliicoccaceae archaeon]|nr:flavodoxin domain-containing protein [Methanomassiliicoccaceae archaeon]
MTETVVIYASKLGSTGKTAHYIAEELGADIFDLKEQSIIDLSRFDRVIIGTGIYAGKPNKLVASFIQHNKGQLDGRNVGLFLCCAFRDDEAAAQCETVSKELGIGDAVFFSGVRKQLRKGQLPGVDSYISKLKIVG